MAKTIKAKRATIKLGDISIDVYMLPDGSYKLSGKNVTDAIEEHHSRMAEIMGVKSLEALPHAGLELRKISAGKEGRPFLPVAIEDAVEFWTRAAKRGNLKAVSILGACAVEAIERRANHVFGVIVEEEEINKQLAERIARVEARYRWTDVIKDYQIREGYYYTDRERVSEEYKDLTVMVNRTLFHVDHFNCDRSTMTKDQQHTIQAFETYLRRKADSCPDKNPYQLVEEALSIW